MGNKSQIIQTAIKSLEIEQNTLRDLKNYIDDHFAECVETIYACKGRIVVTGVGKSALIAQKIVATFNSTGTASIYMHAADAVHGDLGMIRKEDIILCLSKSGETSEIKVLLPILSKFGNTLIGLTAKKESFLGNHADFVLFTPVKVEADPNELAPTASSIAQMAMGDALAASLLVRRGFSPSHFAKFHPGGSLGKQLYLKVKDIYINNERPYVDFDASLNEVILEMTSKRLGTTVVGDSEEKMLGIITDGDLRRMLKKYTDLRDLKAKDLMTKGPKTIEPDALALDAFRLMQENSITQIIVCEGDKYLGIVHIHDLLREGFV